MLSYILWAGGAGLVASVGLVAAARQWTIRRMLMLDRPNDRSLHHHPTPRVGGIGVVLPVFFAIMALGCLAPETAVTAAWLTGAGLLIAVVGVVDDVRGLSVVIRLITHTCAAVLVVVGVGSWHILEWPGVASIDLGLAAVPFTVLLVVGLTNAYNFMDGIDGIAGGQGLVAGIGWIGLGYALQEPFIAGVGAAIAMTSVGFLFFNWSPATIFMGDGGSSFLGFIFAALTVWIAPRSHTAAAAGILFVWPFVFDATFTLLRRARRRENVFHAHRSHLYQRLVLTGVSHATVAFLYGGLATVGAAVGNAVARGAEPGSILGVVLIGILGAVLCLAVARRERDVVERGAAFRPQGY